MYFILIVILISSTESVKDKCETCKEMTEKFREGMERTSGHNFGGGNTDWEETRLGSFADSETRLVDIIEKVCSSPECHFLVEEHEEDIETWWFKEKPKGVEFQPWLCVDTVKVCCPEGKFGPNCEDCPGGASTPCLSHGKCQGDGSRSGSGDCKCDEGYSGKTCNECHEGFYQDLNNTSELSCSKCHESCDGTCTDGSPKGCETCKDGWEETEENGCIDNNECESSDTCEATKYCVNTPGSFKCEACDKSCEAHCTGEGSKGCLACNSGYEMTDDEGCKDKDECSEVVTCEDGQHCKNNPGSYECVACHKSCTKCSGPGSEKCTECSSGYEMSDKGCEDIDECKSGEDLCPGDNELCKNTAGSYSCNCSSGFERKAGKCVQEEESGNEGDDVTEDDVTEDDEDTNDEDDDDINDDEDDINDDADLDDLMHEEL